MDRSEHHSTDRLKERGVEKGGGQHSTLHDRERPVFNQTNIGTVSRATLGRMLRDGEGRGIAYGPFRTLRCHHEMKVKLNWNPGLPLSRRTPYHKANEAVCRAEATRAFAISSLRSKSSQVPVAKVQSCGDRATHRAFILRNMIGISGRRLLSYACFLTI